jgi:hypothetical protein
MDAVTETSNPIKLDKPLSEMSYDELCQLHDDLHELRDDIEDQIDIIAPERGYPEWEPERREPERKPKDSASRLFDLRAQLFAVGRGLEEIVDHRRNGGLLHEVPTAVLIRMVFKGLDAELGDIVALTREQPRGQKEDKNESRK